MTDLFTSGRHRGCTSFAVQPFFLSNPWLCSCCLTSTLPAHGHTSTFLMSAQVARCPAVSFWDPLDLGLVCLHNTIQAAANSWLCLDWTGPWLWRETQRQSLWHSHVLPTSGPFSLTRASRNWKILQEFGEGPNVVSTWVIFPESVLGLGSLEVAFFPPPSRRSDLKATSGLPSGIQLNQYIQTNKMHPFS